MLNRLRQSVYHAPSASSASLPGTPACEDARSPTRIKTWPALPGLWGDRDMAPSGSASASASTTPRPSRTPHGSMSQPQSQSQSQSAPGSPHRPRPDPATAAAMQHFARELAAIKSALETRDDECEALRRQLEQVDAYKAQLEAEVRALRGARSSASLSTSPTTPSSAVMPLTPASDGVRPLDGVEVASVSDPSSSSTGYPARTYAPVTLLPPPKRRSLEAAKGCDAAPLAPLLIPPEATAAVTSPVTSPSSRSSLPAVPAPAPAQAASSPPPTPQLPSSWLSTARAQQELMSHHTHTVSHAGSASDEMIQALQDMLDTVPEGVTIGNHGPLLVLFEREVGRREAADRKVAREIYRRVTVEGQLAVAQHRAAVLERQVNVRDGQIEVAELRQAAAEREQARAEHDLALIKSQFDFIEARLRGYMVQERTRPGFGGAEQHSPTPPPPPPPLPVTPPSRANRNTLAARMQGALGQSSPPTALTCSQS